MNLYRIRNPYTCRKLFSGVVGNARRREPLASLTTGILPGQDQEPAEDDKEQSEDNPTNDHSNLTVFLCEISQSMPVYLPQNPDPETHKLIRKQKC